MTRSMAWKSFERRCAELFGGIRNRYCGRWRVMISRHKCIEIAWMGLFQPYQLHHRQPRPQHNFCALKPKKKE